MQNFITGIIILALTVGLYIIYLRRDKTKLKKVVQKGVKNLIQNSIRIFAIFVIIGILQNFLSKESVGNFLIRVSGLKGIFTGILTGAIMTGPVATSYPIGSYLLEHGGTIALVTSFLASWVMIGFISVSLEIKNFGNRFTVVRNLFAFISVIIIALIMEVLL
ncbi:hypothetical protein H5T89_08525, partial [bacterium]|nr:hypothetical protein [bacterium]